jgi:uncharacterized membrane protein YebE (DUF533 family)
VLAKALQYHTKEIAMLLKLATLGALGYAGYKYYEKNKASFAAPRERPAVALAGGPLSDEARVQSSPDLSA